MISRTQASNYLANSLSEPAKRKQAIKSIAAWLKYNGKSRQFSYVAGDVAQVLSTQGYNFVRIISARELTPQTKKHIESYSRDLTNAKTIECEYRVDPTLIGGVIVETPEGMIDHSVASQLNKLIEGVINE